MGCDFEKLPLGSPFFRLSRSAHRSGCGLTRVTASTCRFTRVLTATQGRGPQWEVMLFTLGDCEISASEEMEEFLRLGASRVVSSPDGDPRRGIGEADAASRTKRRRNRETPPKPQRPEFQSVDRVHATRPGQENPDKNDASAERVLYKRTDGKSGMEVARPTMGELLPPTVTRDRQRERLSFYGGPSRFRRVQRC